LLFFGLFSVAPPPQKFFSPPLYHVLLFFGKKVLKQAKKFILLCFLLKDVTRVRASLVKMVDRVKIMETATFACAVMDILGIIANQVCISIFN